jgi:hypothetical protein
LTEAAVIDRSWRDQCGLATQPSCEEYVATAAPVGIGPDGGLLRISAEVVIVRQAVDSSPPAGGHRTAVEVRTPQSVNPRWWVLTREADGTVTAQLADPSASRISFGRWARAVHGGRRLAGAPELTERPAIIG